MSDELTDSESRIVDSWAALYEAQVAENVLLRQKELLLRQNLDAAYRTIALLRGNLRDVDEDVERLITLGQSLSDAATAFLAVPRARPPLYDARPLREAIDAWEES